MGRIGLVLMLMLLIVRPAEAGEVRVTLGAFSGGQLDGWREKSFDGHTAYTPGECGGVSALRAVSHDQASGLVKRQRIDLRRTPWLHWSWRIGNRLHGVDERSRAGDDYPARVYVVVSGGIFFWRTLALDYVWSSTQPAGSSWPNAYTDHAWMLAVRGRKAATGRWYYEKRNVRADLRRAFGRDFDHIDAIAIMTDTDNSHQAATACYGDLYFSDD